MFVYKRGKYLTFLTSVHYTVATKSRLSLAFPNDSDSRRHLPATERQWSDDK